MFDFLHQLEATQTLLLSVIAFVFTATAILASHQEATDIRVYMLMILTIICIVVGFKAEYIFEELNRNKVYETFFINLSVELASAWLIFPLTIGLWYLFDSLVVPILTCITVVGATIVFLHPEHLSFLKNAGITTRAIHDLVVSIKFEMISTLVVLLALIMLGAVGSVLNQNPLEILEPIDQWIITIMILLATFVIGAASVYMGSKLPAYNPHEDNIQISIIGAIVTTFIIADWIGTNSHTFAVMTIIILVISIGLILQIDDPIWLDSNASIGMSTELLGALIAGVLLNRKWLWNTRNV